MKLAVMSAVALVALAVFAASAVARAPTSHRRTATPFQTLAQSTTCTPSADVPQWIPYNTGDSARVQAHGATDCWFGYHVAAHPEPLYLQVCLQAYDRLDGWQNDGCNSAWRGYPYATPYYYSGYDLFARRICEPPTRGNSYRTVTTTSWWSDSIQRFSTAVSGSTRIAQCG